MTLFEFFTILLIIFLLINKFKLKLNLARVPVYLQTIKTVLSLLFLNREDRFKILRDIHKFYPKFLHLKFIKVVSVYDPEILRKIFNSPACLQRPFSDFVPIDKGLLFAKYHEWKNPRRHLNLSFNLSILKSFIPTFSRYADLTVRELATHDDDGSDFDVIKYISRWVYRTNSATILNVHRVNLPDHEQIFSSINNMTECLFERIVNPLIHPDFVYRRTRSYRTFKASTDFLVQYGNDLIAEARANVENELNRPETHFLVEQLLINQATRYSDQEICDQLLTLLITASDTTVNLVGACLLFLAINQDIQKRLHDEIVDALGDDGVEFDFEHLNELRFLDKVLKETLRVFSPIPVYFRECIDDCDIGIGTTVQQGTKIFILSHIMHQREDIWGVKSRQFDPENFNAEKMSARDSSAFSPFGSGQRNCIGNRYSMIASKVLIVKLIKSFIFTTPLTAKDMKLTMSFTGKLSSPYNVAISKRK